jgi:type VI protein secretion system component VasK
VTDRIFDYEQHPRADELAKGVPIKTADMRKVDHPNALVRFNAKVGLRVTLIVGTMWCAYLFGAVTLFALPSAIHQGTYFIVVWVSSSFLQLVLLPVIIVGQNIQAAAADKRSEETYKDAEAVLAEARAIQSHLQAQDTAITQIVARLESLVAAIGPTKNS